MEIDRRGTTAAINDAKLMTTSDRRIPDDVRDAFDEALILLVQWQGGTNEPVVNLDGKPIRLSLVFDLVIGRKFRDQMPPSMVELLVTYASKDRSRQRQSEQLQLLPTYEIGARCLLKWVGDKKFKSST
jgi:hypothetical protein